MVRSEEKNKIKIVVGRVALVLVCVAIIFIYFWSWYRGKQQEKLNLKSRYTFSITIDKAGNVIKDESYNEMKSASDTLHLSDSDFADISINEIADIWLREFTNQFTQKFVPRSKSLRKVEINPSIVLDEDTNTVLVSFSTGLKDSGSEFFSSWDGIMSNDRLQCEWVIQYEIDNHYNNTATIYVGQMLSSEEYGISQYNESLQQNGGGKLETATNPVGSLSKYEIKNDTLYVTYDGEKMVTVPVDCDNLPFEINSTTELKKGSYQISTSMTAFLYGGTGNNNNRVPLTLTYSNDKGVNWITCEIAQIYTADYYYVNFVDDNNGIIVCGYARSDDIQESSKIYRTRDGGATWNEEGSGPTTNIIKGVIFIDENVGFFCYNYVTGMDSNLYMTKDAGKTFSKVTFEPQELDSTAANSATETETTSDIASDNKLVWGDVYKEALVPIYDAEGMLTVYLTQGSNGVYNSGKTAAKYQSTDKGTTWKYIGQLEITSE